jgi:hypothetical protein
MATGFLVACVLCYGPRAIGCDLLRNAKLDGYWTGAREGRAEVERSPVPLQFVGLVWKDEFGLVESTPNIRILRLRLRFGLECCNCLRPVLLPLCLNILLIPTPYHNIPSPPTHRDSGIQKGTRFVGDGRALTMYLHWQKRS